MPLLNMMDSAVERTEEVQEAAAVLKAQGLFTPKKDKVSTLLDDNSLSTSDLLSALGNFAHNAASEPLRLRALETALKLNPDTRQAMREHDEKAVPIVNIIIQDTHVGVNPILIPRKVA